AERLFKPIDVKKAQRFRPLGFFFNCWFLVNLLGLAANSSAGEQAKAAQAKQRNGARFGYCADVEFIRNAAASLLNQEGISSRTQRRSVSGGTGGGTARSVFSHIMRCC